MMKTELTTLCYIEKEGHYLMLHRIKKAEDMNKGKWIGVGGHFEHQESPEECLIREVKEETGLELSSINYRALVTFCLGENTTEYMHLFTAEAVEDGSPVLNLSSVTEFDEGILKWIKKEDVPSLELWEGDRIFLKLLGENDSYFSLKLIYDEDGNLLSHKLFTS